MPYTPDPADVLFSDGSRLVFESPTDPEESSMLLLMLLTPLNVYITKAQAGKSFDMIFSCLLFLREFSAFIPYFRLLRPDGTSLPATSLSWTMPVVQRGYYALATYLHEVDMPRLILATMKPMTQEDLMSAYADIASSIEQSVDPKTGAYDLAKLILLTATTTTQRADS